MIEKSNSTCLALATIAILGQPPSLEWYCLAFKVEQRKQLKKPQFLGLSLDPRRMA
ncbi:hypothetical protein [Nitrosomonas sp. ANs5]|uniref:hypothetical protein n=1 Tax=Nitrosomonas sp. ANs5 TaxID=3423941 RepID=UPI003D34EFE4